MWEGIDISRCHPVNTAFSERLDWPARRLIAAVVNQAWEDIALGGSLGRAAMAWVYEGCHDQVWSFDWCCEMLGLEPDAVRRTKAASLPVLKRTAWAAGSASSVASTTSRAARPVW